jgi:putative transposase
VRFSFILAEKAFYPVAVMCRLLLVSRSGFYEWTRRGPSRRAQEDAVLKGRIAASHKASRGTYGSPRVHDDLRAEGYGVGRKRVARLMREQGLQGCRPRRFKVTTDSEHAMPIAANLVKRDFEPCGPDELWAADITYIRTWEGWMYLAVVLDLWSRRVVGWSMADHMRTELVLGALEMAVGQREPGEETIYHSDRGSQYASHAHRAALAELGMRCSMSRKGNCWDNACVESFFATLKTELIHRQPWPTRAGVRVAVHEYIGGFYNGVRKHSFLGLTSPVEFERAACHNGKVAA